MGARCTLVAAGSFCSIGIAVDEGTTRRTTSRTTRRTTSWTTASEGGDDAGAVDVADGPTTCTPARPMAGDAEERSALLPTPGAGESPSPEDGLCCGMEILAACGPRVVMAKSGVPS